MEEFETIRGATNTNGGCVGNSPYFSQGAIPKPCPRKRRTDRSSGIASRRFGQKSTNRSHKSDVQHVKEAKDIIESWTWGNRPG